MYAPYRGWIKTCTLLRKTHKGPLRQQTRQHLRAMGPLLLRQQRLHWRRPT